MDNINFTSRIVPMNFKDYGKFVSTIPMKNFVDYPWTTEETKIGKDVFTRNICDCSSCLLTNGEKAVLMHLSPSVEENHHFSNVLTFLRNHIDLKDENLQAILVGSKNTKKSLDIFNKFKELLEYLKIPTTFLKTDKSAVNLAYKTSTDELAITNSHIEKSLKKGKSAIDALKSGFEEVKISDCDEV